MKVFYFSICLVLVALTGCTNIASNPRSRSGTSTVTITGNTNYAFEISNVLLTPTDPTTLTIIGTNPGDIGAACDPKLRAEAAGAAGDEEAPATTALCQCSFTYIRSNGSQEELGQDVSYAESNLVRCPIREITNLGLSSVDVRIKVNSTQGYTNIKAYNLAGGEFLDPSNPNSFLQVSRYQCRDRIRVGYGFGSPPSESGEEFAPLNPILSEDPKLSYPLNFYFTNYFAAMQAYISFNAAGAGGEDAGSGNAWLCPTVLNDPNFGMDLQLYSVSPDTSGSIKIFPPGGSAFDRSTLFLARKKSGLFIRPLDVYGAPGVVTADAKPASESELGSVGYGVSPTPQSDGSETCPDTSVPIPAGFRWVKVWQYRASLEPRQQPKTTGSFSQSALFCNPGLANASATATGTPPYVFGNCESASTAPYDDTSFAARAYLPGAPDTSGVSTNACFELNHPLFAVTPTPCNDIASGGAGSGAGCTAKSDGTQLSSYAALGKASDIWYFAANPSNGGQIGSNGICGGSAVNDHMNMCSVVAATGYPLFNQSIPVSADVTYEPVDASAQQRFDFIYVVSPPSVNAIDMLNASSTTALPYVPYRYYPGGCVSGDPNSPSFPGDCSADQKISYDIKLHGVGSNGDETPSVPGGNPSARLPVFPVCALQPI